MSNYKIALLCLSFEMFSITSFFVVGFDLHIRRQHSQPRSFLERETTKNGDRDRARHRDREMQDRETERQRRRERRRERQRHVRQTGRETSRRHTDRHRRLTPTYIVRFSLFKHARICIHITSPPLQSNV